MFLRGEGNGELGHAKSELAALVQISPMQGLVTPPWPNLGAILGLSSIQSVPFGSGLKEETKKPLVSVSKGFSEASDGGRPHDHDCDPWRKP